MNVLKPHLQTTIWTLLEAGTSQREIERVTGRDLAIGAVYSTLDRLEEKRLLTSRRALDGGPSRRRFALSPAGARALAETRAMRDRLWDGVALQRLLTLAR